MSTYRAGSNPTTARCVLVFFLFWHWQVLPPIKDGSGISRGGVSASRRRAETPLQSGAAAPRRRGGGVTSAPLPRRRRGDGTGSCPFLSSPLIFLSSHPFLPFALCARARERRWHYVARAADVGRLRRRRQQQLRVSRLEPPTPTPLIAQVNERTRRAGRLRPARSKKPEFPPFPRPPGSGAGRQQASGPSGGRRTMRTPDGLVRSSVRSSGCEWGRH